MGESNRDRSARGFGWLFFGEKISAHDLAGANFVNFVAFDSHFCFSAFDVFARNLVKIFLKKVWNFRAANFSKLKITRNSGLNLK